MLDVDEGISVKVDDSTEYQGEGSSDTAANQRWSQAD